VAALDRAFAALNNEPRGISADNKLSAGASR
jgi:hypothetical protein